MSIITTSKNEAVDLKAVMGDESAITESLTTKVEELYGKCMSVEADVVAATGIRTRGKRLCC